MIKKLIPKKLYNKLVLPYHLGVALFGDLIYGSPAKKIKIIAVTGTNGKSTTCVLIAKALEEAGFKVGLSSTVNYKIGELEWANETNKTVLGRFAIPKLIKRMVVAKCDWAVIEVTSHALVQHRVLGLNPDIAVFTNLAPEHLDYHVSMHNYRNAKGKLFAMLKNSKPKGVKKTSILNADDPEFQYFDSFDAEEKVYFGLNNRELGSKFVYAKDIVLSVDGTEFSITKDGGIDHKVKMKLLGKFNVYNALSAFCAARAAGVTVDEIIKALEKTTGVPGRMEFIKSKKNATVIVDYAHTPDAFEVLFSTLRELAPDSKITAVFGATGDRDRTKRPLMGRIAASYVDKIFLTNEEPYTEDPISIIKEVEKGIPESFPNKRIVEDRRGAIQKAIEEASEGDIVTVTGMGHQKYAVYGDKKIPWDDREIVKEILRGSDE